MAAITSGNIKVQSELPITSVVNLDMEIRAGTHGSCILRGYLEDVEKALQLVQNSADLKVKVMEAGANGNGNENEKNTPLFHGIVKDAHIFMENGVYQIILCLVTATVLLDKERNSRSFQDVSISYKELVEKLLQGRGGVSVIYSKEAGEKIGEPVIQYEETDWQFINRMASQLHIPVIPDYITGKANFWFGMKQGDQVSDLQGIEYTAGISRRFHEASDSNLAREQFMYYTVKESHHYEIGDKIAVKGTVCTVYAKTAALEKEELVFAYQAGGKGNWYTQRQEQETLIGLELAGEVVQAQKETVNLKLDIDRGRGGSEYAWEWTPVSGNLMYCMPQKGTKARLCFGSGRASDGLARSGIRSNGGESATCQGMSDTRNRAFVTEHDKKMELFPETINFQGQDMLKAFLEDQKGIRFQSHKILDMAAADTISLQARLIRIMTPQEINMYRSATRAAQKSVDIAAKGSRKGKNPATGGGDSGFTFNFEFNALSRAGILCGTEFMEYLPFDDAPEESLYEKPINMGGIFGKILGALAVVAVVAVVAAYAASVVFTGGAMAAAAPFVVGGLTALCGTAAVMATAKQDIANGGDASMWDYIANGFKGAGVGVMAGATFMLAPYAAESLVTMALSGAPGIALGGMFISAETLFDVAFLGTGAVTLSNILVKVNDAVADISGPNLMRKTMGDAYQTISRVSAVGSNMVFWLGIMNPNLYNRNNQNTGNIGQKASYNNAELKNANYAQNTYSNTFSAEGQKIYSKLAGEPIKTIDDLVNAINEGKVNVSDLSVEYIIRDGNTLILNTRTTQALTQAGIPRSQWNAINRTGNSLFEELLTGQLSRNKLTSEGVPKVRPSGGK